MNGTPILEMGMRQRIRVRRQRRRDPEQQTRRLHHRDRGRSASRTATCWSADRSGSAINHGREFVRVQGIVRPSRHRAGQLHARRGKVADANISYGGQGTVANATKPGWLSRFFNSPRTPF